MDAAAPRKSNAAGPLLIVGLFLLQVCFVVMGKNHAPARLIIPVLQFIVSLAIPYCYLRLLLGQGGPTVQVPRSGKNTIWYFMAGVATLLVSYEEVRKLFAHYPDPAKLSDVMPHMEVLYDRFIHHKYPYSPISFGTYVLYPVYMPFHWLPLWIPKALGIDDRWIGFIFLTLAAGLFGVYVLRNAQRWYTGLVALVLPSVAFWAFVVWGDIEIPASLETLIAAYYLVLATGLAMRNLPLVVAGIVVCLLSRYTFIFWVPFFAFVLFRNVPLRRSVVVWGIVAVCFVCVYLVPFYLKDPQALADGLKYYNECAIGAWAPTKNGVLPGTFDNGLNFGPHMWLLLPGDAVHKVYLSRMIQVGWMLVLLFGGIWYYNKNRQRLNFYDLSLIMLYLFVTFFFMFTAQLFKYYLLTWLILSAVVTAKSMLLSVTISRSRANT